MGELTKEEIKTLIDLVEKERDSLRLASYSDKEANAKYIGLGFISIKLNVMLIQKEKEVSAKAPLEKTK